MTDITPTDISTPQNPHTHRFFPYLNAWKKFPLRQQPGSTGNIVEMAVLGTVVAPAFAMIGLAVAPGLAIMAAGAGVVSAGSMMKYEHDLNKQARETGIPRDRRIETLRLYGRDRDSHYRKLSDDELHTLITEKEKQFSEKHPFLSRLRNFGRKVMDTLPTPIRTVLRGITHGALPYCAIAGGLIGGAVLAGAAAGVVGVGGVFVGTALTAAVLTNAVITAPLVIEKVKADRSREEFDHVVSTDGLLRDAHETARGIAQETAEVVGHDPTIAAGSVDIHMGPIFSDGDTSRRAHEQALDEIDRESTEGQLRAALALVEGEDESMSPARRDPHEGVRPNTTPDASREISSHTQVIDQGGSQSLSLGK